MTLTGDVSAQLITMKEKIITKKTLKNLLFISYCLFHISNISAEQGFLSELSKEKIPSADEAFIFEAYGQQHSGIILSWIMKENCFLYKDKFEISVTPSSNLSIKTLGEAKRIDDIYFGEVDVYFNSVKKELNFELESEFIDISYQGCNAQGFCYPVITKRIDIKEVDYL
jgi:thiol:disulfide interchange protein DsbD|tara:strand:+ start:3021 stop:3530 length:510 start_codon:yes stop_codon:yes gene_type:complete